MDFFDPQKQKQHAIRLGVGYVVIGLGLVLLTLILRYQTLGFGIDRSGRVIQNGLVFLSSQPANADIYLNGHLYKSQTNTRMVLPAGQYTVKVQRQGYRTWQRALTVEGGSLERFDYPFLIPTELTSTTAKQYAEAPSLTTQSDDRRWLLVGLGVSNSFDLYDLKADKPAPKVVAVPDELLNAGHTTGWQLVRWADDDRHVVLRRTYQKDTATGTEYILFDRQNPAESQNLTQLLGFTPSALLLHKGDYDSYYAFDQPNGTVFTASLKKPTPQLYLEHVLAFTVDESTALYATAEDAPSGKVQVRLRQDSDTPYVLRTVNLGANYLLDLAVYSGKLYVAAGAQSEDKVYVYRDPFDALKHNSVPAPIQILKVAAPTYTAFSTSSRFVMAQNNDHFAAYDVENDKLYAYQSKAVPDDPAAHATWLDGYHMQLLSGGKVHMFDFDGANTQTLTAGNPVSAPAFSPDYKLVYDLNGQHTLTAAALRTAQDR